MIIVNPGCREHIGLIGLASKLYWGSGALFTEEVTLES